MTPPHFSLLFSFLASRCHSEAGQSRQQEDGLKLPHDTVFSTPASANGQQAELTLCRLQPLLLGFLVKGDGEPRAGQERLFPQASPSKAGSLMHETFLQMLRLAATPPLKSCGTHFPYRVLCQMERHTPHAHLPSQTLSFLPELNGANIPST